MTLTQDQLDSAWDSIHEDAKDGDPNALATLRKYGRKPVVNEPEPPSNVDWW